MEKRDVFKDRERALEEGYFRAQDAKLVEKMRARAALGEAAEALRDKLHVEDPDLLRELVETGVTPDTGAAVLLAPIVQVAWAENEVTERERRTVLELAEARGIAPGTPAHAKLEEWLDHRPPDRLFELALATIKAGLSVLTAEERADRMRRLIDGCNRVARASGGVLEMLGMGGSVSGQEADVLEAITAKLRAGT